VQENRTFQDKAISFFFLIPYGAPTCFSFSFDQEETENAFSKKEECGVAGETVQQKIFQDIENPHEIFQAFKEIAHVFFKEETCKEI